MLARTFGLCATASTSFSVPRQEGNYLGGPLTLREPQQSVHSLGQLSCLHRPIREVYYLGAEPDHLLFRSGEAARSKNAANRRTSASSL